MRGELESLKRQMQLEMNQIAFERGIALEEVQRLRLEVAAGQQQQQEQEEQLGMQNGMGLTVGVVALQGQIAPSGGGGSAGGACGGGMDGGGKVGGCGEGGGSTGGSDGGSGDGGMGGVKGGWL